MATTAALDRGISDAARETGLTAHTLRYYERAGLMLEPVGRAPSSHRRYSDADVRWVVLLTKLRRTGMPIRQIKQYADLVRAGRGNEERRLALLEEHRAQVLDRLREVQQNLEAIDHKITVYRECSLERSAAAGNDQRTAA
ncbi:MerR family transcriptional regulator [Patulibacter defluvii]|uniref:MerR family transcriptional regulator n=1 Tax=Patulibacter defluvii TaxID=3095358 RepID=UPI002A751D3A|nr:MerR family transcriptional regulator [Patulibacter sp. DM4]